MKTIRSIFWRARIAWLELVLAFARENLYHQAGKTARARAKLEAARSRLTVPSNVHTLRAL